MSVVAAGCVQLADLKHPAALCCRVALKFDQLQLHKDYCPDASPGTKHTSPEVLLEQLSVTTGM